MPVLLLATILSEVGKKQLASLADEDTLERSSGDAEAKVEEVDKLSSPPGQWRRVITHPYFQRAWHSATTVLTLLVLLFVFLRHILFWPLFLACFILTQITIYWDFAGPEKNLPWQPIAFTSILHIALWTIISVSLLLTPNRFQRVLWMGFKWTCAVSWWLCCVAIWSYTIGRFVGRWTGLIKPGFPITAFLLNGRPSLVVYLHSGIVCAAVFAVMVVKYLWEKKAMNEATGLEMQMGVAMVKTVDHYCCYEIL